MSDEKKLLSEVLHDVGNAELNPIIVGMALELEAELRELKKTDEVFYIIKKGTLANVNLCETPEYYIETINEIFTQQEAEVKKLEKKLEAEVKLSEIQWNSLHEIIDRERKEAKDRLTKAQALVEKAYRHKADIHPYELEKALGGESTPKGDTEK
jgi:hypothetical protein